MLIMKRLFIFYVAITNVASKSNENNYTLISNAYKNVTHLTELKVSNIVIRKCCPFKQFRYDPELQRDERCLVSDKLHPAYNFLDNENNSQTHNESDFNFNIIIDEVNCSKFRDVNHIVMGQKEPSIHKNGSIIVEGTNITISPDKYCIDNFVAVDPETNDSYVTIQALICYPLQPATNHSQLICICMLVSCFFILLTLAVYMLLPELRNLHGLVLMTCLLSFLVGLLLLSTMQILLLLKKITRTTCSIFTFIIYYALLAAFFWLNIMCFDIWRTISGKPSMSSHLPSQKSPFISYSMYAFGIPIIFTIILAICEFGIENNNSPWLPNIRNQRCFLYGQSKFLYLYVPIIILWAANLVFFTLTAMKIAEIKKQTYILNQTDKYRFILYIKLFLMMGVNWILEVVSSFYDENYIWEFVDAYNALVGVIFFVVFICKVKTLKRLQERYHQVKNRRRDRSLNVTSTRTSNIISKDNTNWNIQQQTKF